MIPYTTYFIQVAAETVKGRGPYSEQVAVYTPEDGKQTAVPPAILPQFLHHYSSLQVPVIFGNLVLPQYIFKSIRF